MVTFKSLYNGDSMKFRKVIIIIFEGTFLDILGDLYLKRCLKNTPIVASSCDRHGNID
jgi:hypothetical protein